MLELDAGRSTYFAGPWSAWRIEKAARLQAATKEAARYAEDIARLERFVARFRYKKSKAKQAQAKLTQIGRLSQEKTQVTQEISLLTRRSRRLGFGFINPPRSGRTVVEADDVALRIGDRELLHDATFALERGEHVALVGPNGAGKTTLLRAVVGERETDEGRVRIGHSRSGRLFLAAGGRARRAAHACSSRRSGRRVSSARRRRRCSGASSSPGGTSTRSRSGCCPAASAGASRWRTSSRRARTSSCSTSRRTTSTSNRARRSKPRSKRSPERCCSSRTTARSSTPSRNGRSRSRSRRSAATTAAGPSTCAGARSRRRASARERERKPKKARPQPTPAQAKPRPSELERLESEIAQREEALAELERKLADDWANVETLQAHRRARDELQSLLGRWEELFEKSQAQ